MGLSNGRRPLKGNRNRFIKNIPCQPRQLEEPGVGEQIFLPRWTLLAFLQLWETKLEGYVYSILDSYCLIARGWRRNHCVIRSCPKCWGVVQLEVTKIMIRFNPSNSRRSWQSVESAALSLRDYRFLSTTHLSDIMPAVPTDNRIRIPLSELFCGL